MTRAATVRMMRKAVGHNGIGCTAGFSRGTRKAGWSCILERSMERCFHPHAMQKVRYDGSFLKAKNWMHARGTCSFHAGERTLQFTESERNLDLATLHSRYRKRALDCARTQSRPGPEGLYDVHDVLETMVAFRYRCSSNS
jgi:hypothetical protein